MLTEYIPWPLPPSMQGPNRPMSGFGFGAWHNNTFATIAGFRIPNWLGLGVLSLAAYWGAKKMGWIKRSNRGRRRSGGGGRRRRNASGRAYYVGIAKGCGQTFVGFGMTKAGAARQAKIEAGRAGCQVTAVEAYSLLSTDSAQHARAVASLESRRRRRRNSGASETRAAFMLEPWRGPDSFLVLTRRSQTEIGTIEQEQDGRWVGKLHRYPGREFVRQSKGAALSALASAWKR